MTETEQQLREAVIAASATTEKALERLQRAEDFVEAVSRILKRWPGSSAGYAALEDALNEYNAGRPS